MNVAISTFMRTGYLLTALAVAVLLAASSGTAWAQTTGSPISVGLTMRASSSTLAEGASELARTPDRVTVTITRTDPTYDPTPGSTDTTDDNRTRVFDGNGDPSLTLTAACNGEDYPLSEDDCSFSVQVKGGSAAVVSGAAGATIPFGTSVTGDDTVVDKTIELLISDTPDNDDWNEEKIVLTLELASANVSTTNTDNETVTRRVTATPRKLTLTIADDEQQPTFKFTPPNIQLAKGNTQMVAVGVGLGGGGRVPLPTDADSIRETLAALTETGDDVLLSVSPPDAVGTLIEFVNGMGDKVTLTAAREGRYNIGKIGAGTGVAGAVGAVGVTENDDIVLYIKAIDVSGFRDEQITLTLMEGRTEASKMGEGGGIADAAPATVTILSGEETPTVTFSKESISIDEGDSDTVHLLAAGMQGDEVGSATVSVSGDALISLRQNGSAISGGVVSFGGNANAELTIVSLSDPDLEDGDESTATVTITNASGANIGAPSAVTVTVVGSTAVPVLPLLGQLLLALLLTVGGARLYRRHRG